MATPKAHGVYIPYALIAMLISVLCGLGLLYGRLVAVETKIETIVEIKADVKAISARLDRIIYYPQERSNNVAARELEPFK